MPRLLRKWIGKEDKLIAEVTAKYEQKRRREAIIKAAKERDRAAGYGDDAVRAVTFSFLCNYSRNTGL
eukprot:SAG31_NODE_628_length_13432_cov_131.456086_11_plen_68_part_00